MTDKTDLTSMNPSRPFKVPEGYFDSLTERVMGNIPANEVRMFPKKEPVKRRGWQRYAAAAAVVAAIFGSGLFWGHNTGAEPQAAAPVAAAEHTSNSSGAAYGGDFDNVADYIMCDDYELYAYLTSE